ncbi:Uncharacterized protein BP5553_01565 [Venustampulla echinocandica]|uniref:Rhodopsin domain-containing protein n=1 Tax=Venustampulla echinocandica TaxID=2656787 RepID=A0A370U1D3_9HELO|nr:Uncharacterized protein BP5553_01565 [Venustampulla echinocandica]RDL41586.1 Uncharacterized protein BP5553_01565 [Venustampulla echinocandica]
MAVMPLSKSIIFGRQEVAAAPLPFPDQSTNGPKLIALNATLMSITVAVVLARLYVRRIMLKTLGWDDVFIIAATTCGIGSFATYIGEIHHGIGKHMLAILPDEMTKISHYRYFHSIIITCGIYFVKLSAAFFLLRLITNKKYKIFLYCMIAFLASMTLVTSSTLTFYCTPIRASWDFSLVISGEAKCFDNNTFKAIGLFNSCVNIITDFIFALLPVPMVVTLQVNMRTRISLIGVLSLGLVASSAAIVKTVYQSQLFDTPDWSRDDNYWVWSSVEMYIGILAASLPPLRPLFGKLLDSAKSLRSRVTGTATGPTVPRSQKHKYYIQDDSSVAMHNLNQKSNRYDAKVTTSSRSIPSDDDLSTRQKADFESVEDMVPLQGIKKTVQITVK